MGDVVAILIVSILVILSVQVLLFKASDLLIGVVGSINGYLQRKRKKDAITRRCDKFELIASTYGDILFCLHLEQ